MSFSLVSSKTLIRNWTSQTRFRRPDKWQTSTRLPTFDSVASSGPRWLFLRLWDEQRRAHSQQRDPTRHGFLSPPLSWAMRPECRILVLTLCLRHLGSMIRAGNFRLHPGTCKKANICIHLYVSTYLYVYMSILCVFMYIYIYTIASPATPFPSIALRDSVDSLIFNVSCGSAVMQPSLTNGFGEFENVNRSLPFPQRRSGSLCAGSDHGWHPCILSALSEQLLRKIPTSLLSWPEVSKLSEKPSRRRWRRSWRLGAVRWKTP